MANSLFEDIEQLAEEHRMLSTETIRELLRRCMKTRRKILSMVENNDAESLSGVITAVCLWADDGNLYEFLLNMSYDEIEEKEKELQEEWLKREEEEEKK